MDEKKNVLKIDYPGVYIQFCEYSNQDKELSMYIQECLNLRDAGPATFGQYFHGGVLPTLDKDRKAGLLGHGE